MVCELIFFFEKNTIIQQKRPEPKKPHLKFFLKVLGQFLGVFTGKFRINLIFYVCNIQSKFDKKEEKFCCSLPGKLQENTEEKNCNSNHGNIFHYQ